MANVRQIARQYTLQNIIKKKKKKEGGFNFRKLLQKFTSPDDPKNKRK